MLLYVASAGRRHSAHSADGNGRLGDLRGRVRRTRDAETGAAAVSQPAHSVDTLPRYTPGEEGEGCVALPEQDEQDGVEGEEDLKPPPYTVDAGGPVVEGGYGEAHAGVPASPAPVHLQSV